MRYYLDTEFDGPNLLSLAIVAETGAELYLAKESAHISDEWVRQNVWGVISVKGARPEPFSDIQGKLERFFAGDAHPVLIADWPTDFQHVLPLLHDNMGSMINIPSFTCRVERVDAYPTPLAGAVQHNALWDARALAYRLAKDQMTDSELLKELEYVDKIMQSIFENDATEYDHHQPRKFDGRTPREVSGGTIFNRPKDIAYAYLKQRGIDPHEQYRKNLATKDKPL